jgi:hypothetical protein
MKPSTYLRPLLALAIVASLASCGGNNKTYVLGGTVAGLNAVATGEANLVLANGSTTLPVTAVSVVNTDGSTSIASSFAFAFPNKLGYGDAFNVTVKTQPAHQTCNTSSNTGTAGTSATNAVFVICNRNTFSLGGVIEGLGTSTGLVLNNGADTLAVAASATSFTFTGLVADGLAYGVTVLTNPADKTCTIPAVGVSGQTVAGSGFMGAANIVAIKVVCVPK